MKMIKALGSLTALICGGAAIYFGAAVGAQQEMFPLPFLYLLEIAFAGLLAAWSAYREGPGTIAWAVSGILLAFVILGIFSIGPLLIPAFMLVTLQAALQSRKQHSAWKGFLLLISFGTGQGLLMMTLIWLN